MLVTNEQILAEVMKIHVRLAELAETEAARTEREKAHETLLIAHDQTINGNGHLGLKTEMQLLKEGMSRVNWIGALVVAAMVADMVSRIYNK